MLLFSAATDAELNPFVAGGLPDGCATLVSGVGPVEAVLSLTRYLADPGRKVAAVISFGLAGAYPDAGPELLDLCLAEREFLGDLGIARGEEVLPLDPGFAPPREFVCDSALLDRAQNALANKGISCRRGNFVTVSAASGTIGRSCHLRDNFRAICENMEGAALARVCQAGGVPFLEVRCVSNLVLDRDKQVWRADEAMARCSQAIRIIAGELTDEQ